MQDSRLNHSRIAQFRKKIQTGAPANLFRLTPNCRVDQEVGRQSEIWYNPGMSNVCILLTNDRAVGRARGPNTLKELPDDDIVEIEKSC